MTDLSPPTGPKAMNGSNGREGRSPSRPAPTTAARKENPARAESTERPTESKSRKANLSLVPCKFFKAGSCQAGDACPFAHPAPGPQPKQICPWFLQGPNKCRFGPKCALAHVLPGQPMGMDRKNKRAQQQAAREAEAAVFNSPEHLSSLPPAVEANQSTTTSTTAKQSSGIARALEKNDGTMSGFVPSPTLPSSATVTSHNASLDDSSTSSKPSSRPASNPWGMPLPSSVRGVSTADSKNATKAVPTGPARQLGFATDQTSAAASSPPVTSNEMPTSPTKSIEAYNPQPIGSPPKSSPFHSSPFGLRVESESFAPKAQPNSRPALPLNMGRSVSSPAYNGFAATGTSPTQHQTTVNDMSTSVFGTSPFSAPGSKSIFLSNIPRESEDEAARHALLAKQYGKSVNALGSEGPSAITRMMMARNGLVFDEEESEDEEDEDEYLPSSLHDLLSPEELDRRRKRTEKAAAGGNKDFLFSRSNPNPNFLRRTSIVDERDEIVPSSPQRSNGFLSGGSPSRPSNIVPSSYAGHHTGFPGQFASAGVQLAPPSILEDSHSLVSPNTRNRSLLSHPPGSSLPPGLAAGMSRLHFRPATSTAIDTPPTSQPSSYAASPPFSTLGWKTNPIERPSALSRRVSNGATPSLQAAQQQNHTGFLVGSPLSQTWSPLTLSTSATQGKKVEEQGPTPATTTVQKNSVHQHEEELPFEMD